MTSTKVGLLLAVLILWLFAGCASTSNTTSGDPAYVNPTFPCPSAPEAELGRPIVRQHPDTWLRPGGGKTYNQLERFCSYLQRKFAASNMNVQEVETFYSKLVDALPLYNLPPGMPTMVPEYAPRQGPWPLDLLKRMMVRKTAPDVYEIFYVIGRGCGLHYTHQKVIEKKDKLEITDIELWSELIPC